VSASPSRARGAQRASAAGGASRRAAVHLLDGNVLVALVSPSHVHHEAARAWFAGSSVPFATCPITQGTLLRLLMRLGEFSASAAVQTLQGIAAHARHRFWVDDLAYAEIDWRGVMGHRQVTDAYLAALARRHRGRLATFDAGLAALHPDVAVGLAEVG
jgi:uncharacterized protein